MMHGTKPGDTPALRVEGLGHSYGARRALEAVTFAIEPSTFTVLLGLNGAGKSTLFALVTRLYATQQGRIEIFGYEVGRMPGEALRRLGVVFQSRTLDLDLSVMQNMLYHAALHGIGGRDARRRAEAALARIGLADRAGDKARDLSGGQMRRVEIARALLHRPRLLVLDEPTVGLDIRARADILAEVRRLVAEEGVSAFWATHLVDEIAESDDVVVLHRGKILAHGAVPRVVEETGTPDIRAAFVKLAQIPAAAGSEVP
jgi:ABC-2 type transport system ATP-binding protein